MKVLNANEMRAIDSGVTYRTFCGATFTDKTPLKLLVGLTHVKWCSRCMMAKAVYGRWYTFNTRSAIKAAWG